MKIHKAKKAPLKGHPQGVPCAELASRLHSGSPLGELSPQATEGYFRKASHIKQKIPQNPSTVCDKPSPKEKAHF